MTRAESDNGASQRFGRWCFDASTGELSDGSTSARLEPQVAKLLAYFLEHQDGLVSRSELIAAVWDDRVVSDDAINRCVAILRQILTPEDRNAYIETVVRRGFISHFPPAVPEPAPGGQDQPEKRPRRLAVLAGAIVLVLTGAILLFRNPSQPDAPAASTAFPMVAVLPFTSSGTGDGSAFFADGMHDDLLTQLAQLQSIRVMSRTSVLEYRDKEWNIREIGRALGADAILEGGVQQNGNQIRINAQLIDAHSDVHLWAEQYDRELTAGNIFGVQAEIARSIAAALNATLTQQDAIQLNVLPTENMAAYRAYHEAMQVRQTKSIAAPAYFAALEQAVALDPGFVRAWAELAGALSFANINQRDPDSIRRLEDMLEHIRALAPQSSEYLIARAYYTYYVLKEHDVAYELISQARLLRPSDPQVLELQSWIQRRQGNVNGSIETIRQAHTLDPRSHYQLTRLVSNLMFAHRYDEAVEVVRSTPIEDFDLALLDSELRVRDHREPGRLLSDLLALQWEYGVDAEPLHLWEAHVAARDYEGATALLDAFQQDGRSADDWGYASLPDVDLARMITESLQDGPKRPARVQADARIRLQGQRDAGFPGYPGHFYLAMALVSAAEANRSETERLIRIWQREATPDLAELYKLRHYACRALGMSGAAAAAVGCLRSALAEPSDVVPFIEPFLPYYDSVREDPGFLELFSG